MLHHTEANHVWSHLAFLYWSVLTLSASSKATGGYKVRGFVDGENLEYDAVSFGMWKLRFRRHMKSPSSVKMWVVPWRGSHCTCFEHLTPSYQVERLLFTQEHDMNFCVFVRGNLEDVENKIFFQMCVNNTIILGIRVLLSCRVTHRLKAIVTFLKYRHKSNWREFSWNPKLQHTGTWPTEAWPPCRLCYRSAVFFFHIYLIGFSDM